MKIFIDLLVIILAAYGANALDCYSCSSDKFEGESTSTSIQQCYNPVSGTTSTVTCTAAGGQTAYCKSEITINDGIPTSITRSCETSATTEQPAYCDSTIAIDGINVDPTTCTYRCTADDCNTIGPGDLKVCSSACNVGVGGYCDYITGSCVCINNYSGTDCTTAPTITASTFSCVQCNSETDLSCNTTTTATSCSSGSYCYSAQTWLLDESNVIRKNTITRGCTNTYVAVDECSFSNNDDTSTFKENEYFEYTCYSTCKTAGCNTDNPDGVVNGNEKIPLQCVQCTFDQNMEDTDTCSDATTRTPCDDTSATHCSATVKYWISDRTDLRHTAEPDYQLVKVERGCATAAVTAQCNTTSVQHLSFNEVTCQETCQDDGCNVGWPARPKCFKCTTETSDIEDGYDSCKNNPQVAEACPEPYHTYCARKESRRKTFGVDGYYHFISRTCEYKDIGNTCNTTTVDGIEYEACNKTCTENFCNAGFIGSGSESTISSIFLILSSVVVAFCR